jgi:unsaturated chondroitin disaccharide hydrolase
MGFKTTDYLVIIDNMMNLELLFWATKVTGDSSYYKIAVTHANNTIKNHYRPDYSSYHVVNYNPNDRCGSGKENRAGLRK